ncbi:hypothetical protein BpHYR1_027369 [Brachionus plicatilis]|uniref:Uncharacterized protein n=1 Tax=Brachionus plicatilis TaxID=10195 RepID=A0A3M7PRD6_BRAPC|nr:hypothetical protein BpHYR1_027369 [Brachionus plicatilis]
MTSLVQGSELKQKLQNSKFKRKPMPVDFQEVQTPIDIQERDTSSTPSYSSSFNDFNYMSSDTYRKNNDLDIDNSINQYQMNQIMDRLKSQEAKMVLKSKHSHAYKEIISSLLNDNLIAYSKQYDLYIDEEPQVTRISHPELNTEQEKEFKMDKKTILKPKVKRNHSLANNVAQNTTKFAWHRPDLTLPAINDDRADAATKKSRPSTKLSFSTRTGSSFSMYTQRDAHSRKASLHEPKSDCATHRSRITDLIFRGCGHDEMHLLENDSTNVNGNVVPVKQPNSYVTPSFMIRRFDLSEPKQLELAKQDIYKRYSFINDKNVLLGKTMILLNFNLRKYGWGNWFLDKT